MSKELNDLLQSLNPAQLRAATVESHALVWAGPGSGKTQLAAGRAGWLVETGRCQPHELLVVTFTNRAVAQFRERLETMLGRTAAAGIRVSTFHSLALALVEMEGQLGRAEGSRRPQLISSQARHNLLTELIAQAFKMQGSLGGSSRNPILSPLEARQRTAGVGQLISQFKTGSDRLRSGEGESGDAESELQDLEEEWEWEWKDDLTHRLARAVYKGYCQHLKSKGLLDLDDLIPRATECLKKFPKLARLPGVGVRQVLLDETQDTSPQQLELLLGLMEASATQGIRGGSSNLASPQLVAVGDDRQQIFSYLHGGPYELLNQTLDGAAQLHLDVQYRYGPTINQAAGAISWHLGREEITRSARETDDPQDKFKALLEKEPTGMRPGQLPITVYEAGDEAEEGAFVADEIGRIQGRSRDATVAILVRTHRQAHYFAHILGSNGLKYGFLSSQSEPPGRSESEEPERSKLLVNLDTAKATFPVNPVNLALPVTISTIHAAKGAEFDVVFVPGLAQGLFPVGRGQLLEDLRLFFVALTRPRYLLYLSYPLQIEQVQAGPSYSRHRVGSGRQAGRSSAVAPSPFLTILP